MSRALFLQYPPQSAARVPFQIQQKLLNRVHVRQFPVLTQLWFIPCGVTRCSVKFGAAGVLDARLMKPDFAIAFDIDGVLLLGEHAIKGAREAVRLVTREKIPFIIISNASSRGRLRIVRRELGLSEEELPQEHMVLSYSPMKLVAPLYRDRIVLISGLNRDVNREIRDDLGFQRAIDVADLCLAHPQLTPVSRRTWDERCPRCTCDTPHSVGIPGVPSAHPISPTTPLPTVDDDAALPPAMHPAMKLIEAIEAIFILSEPANWYESLQTMTDVLVHAHRAGRHVPVWSANPDFAFASELPGEPRFTVGAFVVCLKALYRHITGDELEVRETGKPSPLIFQYAQTVLATHRTLSPSPEASPSDPQSPPPATPPIRCYMIGDSPVADIAGARAAGRPWYSALVATGMWKPPSSAKDQTAPPAQGSLGAFNPVENPADIVCQDVYEACDWILKHELGAHELRNEAAL
ncbi:HAD hydrolase [Paratrimastix pyriformis]|uniref:HAD hydrolase n=1 Tax=Paratrimastix pyriformis TaxID=342808 RepID=A0ABQ8UC96_9EUKA|nr:HAD hydrolase [Paratrimastix pyriformis]